MSSNNASNVNASRPGRRVSFHSQISTNFQRNPTESEKTPTPLEAALAVSLVHIATLHTELTTFLSHLVERCLKDYAEYFYANEKNTRMRLNTAPVPSSVKKIKLNLQPLEEVRECEDFKALSERLVAETEALHRKWAVDYSIVVDTWNCNAHLRRFQFSVCTFLRNAASAFRAQLGIIDTTEDEIVINFFAASHSDILDTPLLSDLPSLLRLYKEANKLSALPASTIQGSTPNINDIINEINQGIPSTANIQSTGPTTVNAASTTMPRMDADAPSTATTPSTGPMTLTAASTAVPRMDAGTHDTAITLSTEPTTVTAAPMATPRTNTGREHIVTPSTAGLSLTDTNNTTTLSSASTVATSTPLLTTTRQASTEAMEPIMHNGRATGYYRPIAKSLVATTPEQVYPHPVFPQGDPPTFQAGSPITMGDSLISQLSQSFTQNEPPDLDASLTALDMTQLNMRVKTGTVQLMLKTLFLNSIKKAIVEFNACIIQREETNRIKSITTRIPMESLAAKVTEKILTERAAERPILSGLIHDETEKAVGDMKRKLQSALDQIESNKKRLMELQSASGLNPHGSTSSSSKRKQPQKRQAKNNNGGNLIWSRTQNTSSTAAAANSSTTQKKQTQTQVNSHAVQNNATAMHRRKRNKKRSPKESRGKDNN
jgi:hypothetical protein